METAQQSESGISWSILHHINTSSRHHAFFMSSRHHVNHAFFIPSAKKKMGMRRRECDSAQIHHASFGLDRNVKKGTNKYTEICCDQLILHLAMGKLFHPK